MDPIKAEKPRAMKCYKKKQNYNKSNQFLYSLIVHALIAVTCSLLCSYSYLFPSLYTIKHLLFISLPNSWSGFINPKCLFIVVNFIVVFLIGESRLSSGKQSSPVTEMYNEYVERSWSLRRPLSKFQEKKEERTVPEMLNPLNEGSAESIEDKEVDEGKQDDKHDHDHDEEDFKECGENDEEEKEEEKEEEEKEEEEKEGKKEEKEEREEEEALMPAEELNKRVEDFIARVNKQRWLEARYLVCCKA